MHMFQIPVFLHIFFTNSVSVSADCDIYDDPRYSGLLVSCSHRDLNHIPPLPFNTTTADLSFNSLSVIQNESFSHVPNIKYLDLSHNVLNHLEPLAFQNCHLLQHLDLSDNNLALSSESFPDVVFDPLFDLRWLNMKHNQKGDGTYPERIFQNLSNLSVLSIGAYKDQIFGSGFGDLHNLRELYIGDDDCELNEILNNTFNEFVNTSLEKLEINFCRTEVMEAGSLAPFPKLTHLDLRNLHLGTKQTLTALAALEGRRMKQIHLQHIRFPEQEKYSSQTILTDLIVQRQSLQFLAKICVEIFQIPENNIIWIDLLSLADSPFAHCIHDVDISSNALTGYILNFLLAFESFPKLRAVYISNPAMESVSANIKPKYSNGIQMKISEGVDNSNPCLKNICNVSFPRHLAVINVSGLTRNYGPVYGMYNILHGKHIVNLNFSFFGLKDIDVMVAGLENLRVFDLSGSINLNFKNFDIFSNVPNLEELRLSYSSFQQTALMEQGHTLLKTLPSLKRLYLAYNQLYQLPSNLFDSSSKLEFVDLSGNLFNSIPFDIGLLPGLKTLDMSFNTINSLTKHDRDMIDRHRYNYFNLILMYNLFACGCDSVDFLLWLKETNANLDNKRNYTCLEGNEGMTTTEEIINDFLKTWRKCYGRSSFYITLVLFTILVASILGTLLVKTNKTSIIYVFLNSLKKQLRKPMRKDFKWDVYVAYAEKDYQWICLSLCPQLEQMRLNVYIYDRDSVPGDSIPDQIAENISKSWKIILYFSNNYEIDQWSYMSMMAAINSVDNLNPEKLLLLLPEEEHPRLPMCLLKVVPESCIFHVPKEREREREFIRSLTEFVKK